MILAFYLMLGLLMTNTLTICYSFGMQTNRGVTIGTRIWFINVLLIESGKTFKRRNWRLCHSVRTFVYDTSSLCDTFSRSCYLFVSRLDWPAHF